MNIIPYDLVLKKLNKECWYIGKKDQLGYKWKMSDIESENHRKFCYREPCYRYDCYQDDGCCRFELCDDCKNTLDELQLNQYGLIKIVEQIESQKNEIDELKDEINELKNQMDLIKTKLNID